MKPATSHGDYLHFVAAYLTLTFGPVGVDEDNGDGQALIVLDDGHAVLWDRDTGWKLAGIATAPLCDGRIVPHPAVVAGAVAAALRPELLDVDAALNSWHPRQPAHGVDADEFAAKLLHDQCEDLGYFDIWEAADGQVAPGLDEATRDEFADSMVDHVRGSVVVVAPEPGRPYLWTITRD
ncbi:hypothetical protein GCM10022221_67960 [Actinocorallia aurea]